MIELEPLKLEVPVKEVEEDPVERHFRPQPLPIKEEPKVVKKSLFDRLFRRKKLEKPEMVAVIFLRNNRKAEFIEVQPKKSFFEIDGKIYHEDRDCIWTISKEGLPLAIIREWDMIPIGTKDWETKPIQEKFAQLQDHTIRAIRHAEIVRLGEQDGKKINPKIVIGLIIVAIVVFALFKGYA